MPLLRVPAGLALMYGLFFFAELGQSMLVPIVPLFAHEYDLSPTQTGALLSAATFATVVAALPAGLLAARAGALRVSIAAAALLAVSMVVHAAAGDFATLMLGRVVYGVAFATVWTAGIALLSATPSGGAKAMAGAVTVGGISHLVGPPLSGYLTELVGVVVPFLIIAIGGAAVAVALSLTGREVARTAERAHLRRAAGAAWRQPVLRSAVVLIAFVGTISGVVPLVVPMLLDAEGYSSGQIGAVFAVGSVMWIATSALAVRAGTRAINVGVAGLGLVLLGAAALVPAVALVAPCVIAFVLLRACFQAPLSTINYALGEDGARTAGVATGTAVGILNLVWGAFAAIAPLVAGGIIEGAGPRWVFALLCCCCLAAGMWMLAESAGAGQRRRPRVAFV
jgi:predicted MFS family arabinose efflux permease